MPSPDRPNIVVAESVGFPAEATKILEKVGRLRLLDLTRSELLDAVRQADLLWVRLRHEIDSQVIDSGANLRVIATPTTGLTHINIERALEKNIQIVSLQGETEFLKNVRATAEHTIALILALIRHLPAAVLHASEGRWDRDSFKGHELYRKVAGVVGYGRLGRIVARYLLGFEMDVLAADPHVQHAELENGVKLVSLDELLRKAHLVTLHVNMAPENMNFFGKREFALMREGAWFINTSRGELVDESALLDALRSKRLRGAAVDVLRDEQSSRRENDPLLAFARRNPDLIITPHLGGCTYESMEMAEIFVARKISRMAPSLFRC